MSTITMTVTGHRPTKLGGYSLPSYKKLNDFSKVMIGMYQKEFLPIKLNVNVGMALGWDMAVARACLSLRVPYTAYIPFEGQERLWSAGYQNEYRDLLKGAKKVINTDPGGQLNTPNERLRVVRKMLLRNQRMVDDCSLVLALWDGTPSGTRNCVNYANSLKIDVHNRWDMWVEFNRVYKEIKGEI